MNKYFKKITYCFAIILFALVANLHPLQAARLVPGTVPDKVPLQAIPPNVQPNYSGGMDSHTTDQGTAPEQQTPIDDGGLTVPADSGSVNNPILPKSPITTATQIWIWLGAVIGAALLAAAWYFLRIKTKKPYKEAESVLKFKK